MYGEVLISCILILIYHIVESINHGITFADIGLLILSPVVAVYRFKAGPYHQYQKNYFSAWRRDLLLFSFMTYLLWYNLKKTIPHIEKYSDAFISLAGPFFIGFVGFLSFLFESHFESTKATVVNIVKNILHLSWVIYLSISISIELKVHWPKASFWINTLFLIFLVIVVIEFIKKILKFKNAETDTKTISKLLALTILVIVVLTSIKLNLEVVTNVASDHAGSIFLSIFLINRGYKLNT